MCLRLLHRLGDLGRDRAYCRADPERRGPNGSVAVSNEQHSRTHLVGTCASIAVFATCSRLLLLRLQFVDGSSLSGRRETDDRSEAVAQQTFPTDGLMSSGKRHSVRSPHHLLGHCRRSESDITEGRRLLLLIAA